MKYILLIVLFIASTAQAQIRFGPHDRSVDQMTCAEAQAYATRHGYYWKKALGQILPMYPIVALEGLRCGVKKHPMAQWERTLDQRWCVLTYYCACSAG